MTSSGGTPQRRMLLVHAHPDDETINNGATMARYAAEGVGVTLVTCTLGEEGEVLVPELALLAAGEADQLGGYRIAELARACQALGVRDHRFLGGAGRYRDSGMMGTPANDRPRAFWRVDLELPVRDLVEVVREVRPQVLVTYDENGGYGHPDHIQAHRVAMAAVERAADPDYAPDAGEAWQVSKVYWCAVPHSVLRAGIEAMRAAGQNLFDSVEQADDLPFGVPDEVVTTAVDGSAHSDAKFAALRAHATQISVDFPFFALADNVGQQAMAVEYYILARGERGPGTGPNGWEDDLFAGLA
jgi:N-acetyl-1-D-myo-inositol-2-amino-2-deoxy-alpha-D-glucopyranoside deacetylase